MKNTKKILAVVLSVLMIMTAMVFPSSAAETVDFNDGTWTAISTAAQLKNINNNLSGKYYLTRDITLSGTWTPIGWDLDNDDIYYFTGILDGNGYTIKGLTYNNTKSSYIGLIALIYSTGAVYNLNVEFTDLVGYSHVGAIAGINEGLIYNVTVTGNNVVTTANGNNNDFGYSGGVAGINNGDIVLASANVKNVTAIYAAGGICGENNGTIASCTASGAINATQDNRIAYNNYYGYNYFVDPRFYGGGITGSNSGTIKDSIVKDCTVSASDNAGLIAGESSGTIERVVLLSGNGLRVNANNNGVPVTLNSAGSAWVTAQTNYGVGENSGSVSNVIFIGSMPSTAKGGITSAMTEQNLKNKINNGTFGDAWTVDSNGNIVLVDPDAVVCSHENTTLTNLGAKHGYVCDDCGETVSSADHSYGAWTVVTAATCTANGLEKAVCKCGAEITRKITATGHNDGIEDGYCDNCNTCFHTKGTNCVSVDKNTHKRVCVTCGETLETGIAHSDTLKKDHICDYCGEKYTEHTYEWVKTATTHKEYCTYCGDVRVAEANHTVVDWTPVENATCQAGGTKKGECTVCGMTVTGTTPADPTAHVWGKGEVTKAPTCQATGVMTYKCTLCDAEMTEDIAIDENAHVWGDGEVTTAPTCSSTGVMTYTCACGAKKTADIAIDENAHKAVSANNAVAATCTENGKEADTKCEYCGITLEYGAVILAAHKLEKVNATDPTCTTDGNHEYYKCTVCGEAFKDADATVATNVEDEKIPAAHTRGEAVKENVVAAECGVPGSYDEVVYCTECHDELSRVTVPVDALKHNWSDWTVAKASTCTEEGTEERTCSLCNITETNKLELAAHVDNDPMDYRCDVCNALLCNHEGTARKTNKVDYIPATCTKDGSHVEITVCAACNTELGRETVVDKCTGHIGSDVITHENVVDATCTKDGSYDEVHTCSECKVVIDRIAKTIDKKGHDLSEVGAKAATCTADGHKAYWTCSRCDVIFADAEGTTETTLEKVTIAAGHKLVEVKAKDATCTENGNEAYWACSKCECIFADAEGTTETTLEKVTIAAGHKLDKVDAKDATCTEDGNIAYWTCSECDVIFADAEGTTETTLEKVTIAAAHKLVKVGAKASTCEEFGNNEYYECSVCKKAFKDENATVSTTKEAETLALTGHTLSEWIIDKEVTCTEDGLKHKVCTVCNQTIETEVVKAELEGHKNVITVGQKPATCTEDGYTGNKYCTACDTIVSTGEVIKATGHKTTVVGAKAPSCGVEGYTGDTVCTVCNTVVEEGETIAALKHSSDNFGYCKHCGADLDPARHCTCLCHNTGKLTRILYAFVLFFWRVMGINKECGCGTRVHY